MTRRRYTAATQNKRCQATVILRDKSTAQCMRAATNNWGDLCAQHAKMPLERLRQLRPDLGTSRAVSR